MLIIKKVLEVKNLKKYFNISKSPFTRDKKIVKAVNGISFDLYEGEVLGIVGESGSGKSTLGRTLLRMYEPTEGEILYNGTSLTSLNHSEFRQLKKNLQMIFQDPFASLNPRLTIEKALIGPMLVNDIVKTKDEAKIQARSLMEQVGLQADMLDRFPHEFSGGQRQRIGIARALTTRPKVIIADESVSALDVSVQAQIINLFKSLREKYKLTYIFIGHDLSVIKYISDRIIVMYLGEIVEVATSDELFVKQYHPYTRALTSAIPTTDLDRDLSKRIILEGDIPSPLNLPSGCYFHTRCYECMEICKIKRPILRELYGRQVRCHLYDEEVMSNG